MSIDADATVLGNGSGASEDRLPAGAVVGEYIVEDVLGEGGFGTVYRATHPIIGKTAAIKVLKRDMSARGEMVSRFIAEARAVNQIRHRNIIDIFAFGVLPDGRHYYVMEHLDGLSLEAHLRKHGNRVSVSDAITILRPLARALHAAHGRGIAHRDIKPDNVFLTFADEGEMVPKLLDFGIAKLAGDGATKHRTAPGVQMGTPAYMAPEQVHGRATDHRADIYTFGVMVFEMLTGQLPFDGQTAMEVMIKHVQTPAPPMSSVAPDLPAALDGPVLRMMEKDPDVRPTSLLAAMDDLVAAAELAGLVAPERFARLGTGEPSSVGGSRPSHDASVSGAQSRADRSTSAGYGSSRSAMPPSRQRGWVWAVAAVGAIGTAVVLVGSILSRTSGPGAAPEAEATAPSAPSIETSEMGDAPVSASAPSVAPVESIATTSASAVPEVVKLSLSVMPPDADVYLGDERLGRASDALTLPRGTTALKLVVRRPGYIPKPLDVVPSADVEQKIVLVPVPKKKEYSWD